MFADDLNFFQLFDCLASLEDDMSKLIACSRHVHQWGRTNRVSFDAGKEHLVIFHPDEQHGDPFKLLGLMIDFDLRMHTCIDQLLSKIRPKCTAILRTRAYYSVTELIGQYITHVCLWKCTLVHIFTRQAPCTKNSRGKHPAPKSWASATWLFEQVGRVRRTCFFDA